MVRSKMFRRITAGSVIVLLLSGAAGAAAWHATKDESRDSKSRNSKPSHISSTSPMLVKIFKVPPAASLATSSQLTGSVRARYETNVAFRVAGKVLSRKIEVGDHVRAGQLLFELDPTDYQLQLKSSQANLEVAEAAVKQAVAEEKRLFELRKSNAVSASEHDRGLSDRDIAIGRRDSAQKQLEMSNNQLDYCTLRADNDGIVTAITAEAGQVVPLGAAVCTIAQRQPLEAVVDIPENRLPADARLQTRVKFWSLPGLECRAELRELSPNADPLTRTYRGRFTLLNPPANVQLGMTATVALTDAADAVDFEIPSTAILRSQDKPAVWQVANDGSLRAVPVELKQLEPARAIVTGLRGGESIVAAGVHKLDATMRVRPWEAK